MAPHDLRRLFARRHTLAPLMASIAEGGPLSIEDADGQLLHGEPLAASEVRYPVTLDGTGVGWVAGGKHARRVAAMLDHIVSNESEQKAMRSEVLHLYREVNLIYSFSEKLAAVLDLNGVASLTLQEARHLINATDGIVMLLDERTGTLTTLSGFGEVLPAIAERATGRGLLGCITAGGNAEIVNDVDADARRLEHESGLRSVACAPMKVGDRVIGAIALANTGAAAYTAGDLKLLNTLALQAATAIENARLFQRTVQAAEERERMMARHELVEIARAKLESEFDLAAGIRADLFPASLPRVTGYEFGARNRPARRCGGDYYDALIVAGAGGAERVLVCVADVSGKGMPAAMLMSNMQAMLRALSARTASVTELAAEINDLVFASTPPNRYVTAALLDFDPISGAGRYVSAGHVDCMLVKAEGAIVRLGSTGTPLGLLGAGLPFGEVAVALEPGDCLVLYSDGVPDAQNEAGDEFGEAQLLEVLADARRESAEGIVGRVFSAIDRFKGAEPQFDDITVLVVQRRASPA
jgi:serine phosphatase RsbU (regulator of sigma subunit)